MFWDITQEQQEDVSESSLVLNQQKKEAKKV